MAGRSLALNVTTTRVGDPSCQWCESPHPLKMNPWRMCPEPVTDAALTLDAWGTPSGRIDGAIEVSPGSSVRSDEARGLVAAEMRRLLDGGLDGPQGKVVGGMERPDLPDDPLDSPTCLLNMAWDEERRRISGPGYGPLSNACDSPQVFPVRELIEWTLAAVNDETTQ